jgi:DNA polymerase-1
MRQQILDQIKQSGFKLEISVLSEIWQDFSEKKQEESQKLDKYVTGLNPNSTKQVAQYLFDLKKIKPVNNRSTDARVLTYLAKNGHIEANHILNIRKISRVLSDINTLCSTQSNLFDESEDFVTINPDFVTDSITGRLYLKNPNILSLSREIRKAIVPAKNNCFINFDYDRQEFLIVCVLSGQIDVIEETKKGIDVFEKCSKEFKISRDDLKTTFYAKMYRQTSKQLSIILNCSEEKAKYYHTLFDKKFPKISQYLFDREIDLQLESVVTTKIAKREHRLNLQAENLHKEIRRGLSFEIQGTGADIMDLLLNDKILIDGLRELKARIVVPVWDALLVESPIKNREKVEKFVKARMEILPANFGFPQFVSYKSGKNWFEAK